MSIPKISPSVVDFDAGITISTTDNSDNLTLTSTDTDANTGPVLNLNRAVTGADDDLLGSITFAGQDDANNAVDYAFIQAHLKDASDGAEDGLIDFQVMHAGTSRSALILNGGGTVIVNQDSQDMDFRVESDGDANMLFVDGGNNRVGVGTSPDYRMHIFTADSGASAHANSDDLFIENSGNAGITIGSGTTSNGSIFFSDSDSSLSGQIEYRHNGDSLYIYTGGGSRVRIDSDGLKFGNDTASANALDDYEEGDWTPSIGTGTFASADAHYIKIGRLVKFSCRVNTFNDITTNTSIAIGGLPYPVETNQAMGSVMGIYTDNTDADTTYANTSETLYFYSLSSGSWDAMTHADINNSSADFYVQGSYRTEY